MSDAATVIALALRSLWNRRLTAALTVLTIAVSVTLLLGVERVRTQARTSFASTLSGTDLVVGARTGDVNLLLYSVFRIGNATSNIRWTSYRDFAERPLVAWTIPISLGDSHRGFRVLGTSGAYFEHYRFGRGRALEFAGGRAFGDVFEAVLGADVARALGHSVGDPIVIAHGLGSTSFAQHDDQPFTVVGILAPTGTPVDRTVHVPLEGIEAIHVDWQSGARVPGRGTPADAVRAMDLAPAEITAFLVGLKSRVAAFRLLREINEYEAEPLLAILPGVTLQQLWEIVGGVEIALLAISAFVVVAGLVGMLAAILTSLNERRREMAILRAVGARPWHLFVLLVSEAGVTAAAGFALGLALVYGVLAAAAPWVQARYGLSLELLPPGPYDAVVGGAVVGGALVMGLVPAWRAYRNALADGLTVRL